MKSATSLASAPTTEMNVSYFMEGPVGHTFVSFIFDNPAPLSISIETRPEVGEGFAPVASMFKAIRVDLTLPMHSRLGAWKE